ncbi:MAG: hypothetical protein N2645_02860 [Clostridia bacterium]|nr:hypothetical protein [Clostridia bacterium]
MKKILLIFIFVMLVGCSSKEDQAIQQEIPSNSPKYTASPEKVSKQINTPEPEKKQEKPLMYQEFNSRKLKWGMGKENVEKTLNNTLSVLEISGENYYYHQGESFGLKSEVYYDFINNKLSRVTERINDIIPTSQGYLDVYKDLKNKLKKIYGKPKAERLQWKVDTYKNQPQKYEEALVKEHVTFIDGWEKSDTIILLVFGFEDGSPNVQVSYESKRK